MDSHVKQLHRFSPLAVAVFLTGASMPCRGADRPADVSAATGSVTVLDLDRGSFIGFARWKTPSVATKDGRITPLLEPARKGQNPEDRKPLPVVAADPPAKEWASPSFDDSRWACVRGPLVVSEGNGGYGIMGPILYMPYGAQAEWGLFCLRGAFRVDDPAQVKDLKLSLRYMGGAAVYVNGRELCRGHLPAGPLDADTLAERYPDEAYLRPDGRVYGPKDGKEFADRMKVRTRELPDGGVSVPAAMLRKGINVMAVEVHSAPLGERIVEYTGDNTPWPHAGILAVRLSAAGGATPNVGAPEDIELWTSQQMETVEAWQYAHPAEAIRPIRIVGARNGTFSGKVALSSKSAMRNIRATLSTLVENGGGKLPPSAAEVRYAELATPAVSWRNPEYSCYLYDRLLDKPPAEVTPVQATFGYGSPRMAAAAVAPVWVTVRVPADAKPGDYRGALTVQAEGTKPVTFTVPVELKIHDWRVPDYRDFTVHHNLYQSPDTVARYYQVPLWSDRHWELMGKSLEVLAQVGNRLCVAPLVEKGMAIDNTESMVRWVRKSDGTYSYDFAILEKYLDLYAAKCGKPGVLQLYVWENTVNTGSGLMETNAATLGVTVLDPATGKTETLKQPPYGTPENEAFWKPVMAELRQRLEKRGWFDVAAVVNASYCRGPSAQVVTVYKHIWPDGKWMQATHALAHSFPGVNPADKMPVMCNEWVWGSGGPLYNPDRDDQKRTSYPRPWKTAGNSILLSNVRAGSGMVTGLSGSSRLSTYRLMPEAALQGNVRGIGRVGGDFWPVPEGKKFRALGGNYGGCSWNCNTLATISPGPDGAIFNERMEMFREGVQVAEAIIYLQKALEAGGLPDECSKRIGSLLDERARYYLRTRFTTATVRTNWLSIESSNWQERDDRLFALAAEVAHVSAKTPGVK
jgi:hypothetical protein